MVLPARRSLGFSGAEHPIFGTPEYQRAFALSYLSETDVEPKVTTLEFERMQDALALMVADANGNVPTELVDGAIEAIQKRNGPEATAAYDFTLANLYYQKEDYRTAADAYQRATGKHQNFRRAWKNLAVLQFRQEQFDAARASFSEVIRLGGSDSLTWGLMGVCATSAGDHVSAESAYRMASMLEPASDDWKLGLAQSLFRQGRYDAAASLFDGMLAADPTRGDIWLLQANAFIGLQQPLKAAENYELVDQLGKSTSESLNTLGIIYVNEQLFGLAVGAYKRSLALDDEASPSEALVAAKTLNANGARAEAAELVAAVEALRAGRLDEEQRKDVLKLKARIAVGEGQAEEEARLLEEVVALDPLDGDALILLGQYYARQENPEQAVFYYEQAANLEEFEADAKVRHAQLLVGQGQHLEALRLLRRAQSIEPREHVQNYLEEVERIAQKR